MSLVHYFNELCLIVTTVLYLWWLTSSPCTEWLPGAAGDRKAGGGNHPQLEVRRSSCLHFKSKFLY